MSIVNRVHFFAQQVVDISATATKKYELLSRPRNPWGGTSIEQFFSGLEPEQHLCIIEAQLSLAEKLFETTGAECAINVDNMILKDESHQESLCKMAEAHHFPVTFEFTEVNPMPPVDKVNPLLNTLRSLGITPSLDDFGTGFNGMSLFVDYDFDIVKIDRSLISDLSGRSKKAEVLGLLAKMIDTLDKAHVVEGVESIEQLALLADLGFHCFQGFYFHQPEPVQSIMPHSNLAAASF